MFVIACVVTTEWEIKGKGVGQKIDEMWFQKIVTKVLINHRFRLGQLIDTKAPKPPEVSTECWNDLVKWRASEVSKKKSAQMRSISRRRASKACQMQGLREAALVRLVMQLFPSCNVCFTLLCDYLDVCLNNPNVCFNMPKCLLQHAQMFA
jgi:hypothetical protein